MGILIVMVAVFGIYSAGLAPDRPGGPGSGAPDIHAARETLRHEPAMHDEKGFLPSRLLDCRAHGSRVLYRDLSRPPAHGVDGAAHAGTCGERCVQD